MFEPSLIVGKRPYEAVSASCFSVKWSRRTVFTMLAFIKAGRRWRGWVGTVSSVVQVNEIVTELAARTLWLVLPLVQGVVPFGFQTHCFHCPQMMSIWLDSLSFQIQLFQITWNPQGKTLFWASRASYWCYLPKAFFLCAHFVLKENTSCMVWPGM